MGLWTRVRAWLPGQVDQKTEPDRVTATDASTDRPATRDAAPETRPDVGDDVAVRQERAASRLLEDERLRGDLTDDEFQPLLDWALEVTDRLAASTAGLPDAEAGAPIDHGLQAIREIVAAAGAAIVAHAEGDVERRSSELAFVGTRWSSLQTRLHPRASDQDTNRHIEALSQRLDATPDLSGPEIATGIVGLFAMATDQDAASRQREDGQ